MVVGKRTGERAGAKNVSNRASREGRKRWARGGWPAGLHWLASMSSQHTEQMVCISSRRREQAAARRPCSPSRSRKGAAQPPQIRSATFMGICG